MGRVRRATTRLTSTGFRRLAFELRSTTFAFFWVVFERLFFSNLPAGRKLVVSTDSCSLLQAFTWWNVVRAHDPSIGFSGRRRRIVVGWRAKWRFA